MTGLECIIPLAVLGALLAGAQIDRGANATPPELDATETRANGCLLLLILVAALATLLVLAGAGAGMAH